MDTTEDTNAPQSETFLSVNAVTNALDYLESAAHFLERRDDFKWKWIAISVYHALYSFCILALEKGNPEWTLSYGRNDDDGRYCKRGQETRWSKSKQNRFGSGPAYRIEWEETDEEPSESKVEEDDLAWTRRKLIGFWTAIARIQDERSIVHDVVSKPVAVTDEDLRAIQWLALRVRNELIHFVPKFWDISIEGIQSGSSSALKVIESLVFESHTLYRIDEDGRCRIRKAIDSLRSGLTTR